jgi:hypothetical protein
MGQLGQVRARGTWLHLARVWVWGEPPPTALGRAEADFFAGRLCAA